MSDVSTPKKILIGIGAFFGMILIIGIIMLLSFGGKWFNTAAERVIYQESFQYKEGMNQRRATLKAQIAEIDSQIVLNSGNPEVVEQLKSQRKVLEIQLNATPE